MKNIFMCFIFVCYFFLSSCTPSETISEGDCSCGKVIEASTFQVQGNHFTVVKVKNNCTGIIMQLQKQGIVTIGTEYCHYN